MFDFQVNTICAYHRVAKSGETPGSWDRVEAGMKQAWGLLERLSVACVNGARSADGVSAANGLKWFFFENGSSGVVTLVRTSPFTSMVFEAAPSREAVEEVRLWPGLADEMRSVHDSMGRAAEWDAMVFEEAFTR